MDLSSPSSCLDPATIVKCSLCEGIFKYGDAPHDIKGPLCVSCNRGGALVELDDSDWPITCNNCGAGTTEAKMKKAHGRENFEAMGDICPLCSFDGGLMWDFA